MIKQCSIPFPKVPDDLDGEGLSFVHLRDGADEVEFLYNEIFVLQSYFKSGIDLKDGACVTVSMWEPT